MDSLTAEVIGTIVTGPEFGRTRGGLAWARFSVAVDTEGGAETIIRVSVTGPDVPDLDLAVGARVFCGGGLKLRHWKTTAGELRAGLSLTARRVEGVQEVL